jgi:2-polyprenyl-6-methoxyphenol hydroxylase-like FAD-dependent oxidoreductase
MINYDCIIVGGAFTGLHTAISIKEKNPHLNIAILEMSPFNSASGKNAGFLVFSDYSEILADIGNKNGMEEVAKITALKKAGVEILLNRLKEFDIDL